MLGMTAGTEICEPMKALIAEGDQILQARRRAGSQRGSAGRGPGAASATTRLRLQFGGHDLAAARSCADRRASQGITR